VSTAIYEARKKREGNKWKKESERERERAISGLIRKLADKQTLTL
jgi:hypothetical protein